VQRKEPLKEILTSTRVLWDRPGIRSSVITNFDRVLKCRTDALGSEVYASSTEQKVVHHTCKSRACPSCGHRATTLWQREMWTALPDIEFAGIVFTMPDVLWPILRRNRHLLDDLPALGAAVIDQWSKETFSAQLMIMVVRHTFGRHLNFNPHLHVLVSDGGLRTVDGVWIVGCRFDKRALMKRWRYALIMYLREALKRGLLQSKVTPREMRRLLTIQYGRWWSVDVQRCTSKEHFLRYAGRYVRRPPLAQYRILANNDEEVTFHTKDHRLKKVVVTRYDPADFIRALSDHVPDHYRHAIRHFGLLAPRAKRCTFGAVFAQLGQLRRPKPRHLSWAKSIERSFAINPLLDSRGEPMRYKARRVPAVLPKTLHSDE
jgi:Putative transposase/Transposase zinc-binding domain